MQKRFHLPIVVTAILILGTPSLGVGQEPGLALAEGEPEMVDRVLAVVGDSIVLWSQVEEHLAQMQATGANLPSDPTELDQLRRSVLDDLVDQQLILQAALRDTTIVVPEGRVEEALDQAMQERVQAFGSQSALQDALTQQGLTLTAFRSQLRSQIRQQMLFQRYFELQQQRAGGVLVDEEEMRAFYEANREQLEARPATISFRHVVIQPEPSSEATAEAREEAQRILDMVRGGGDFADLARQFSQDPGSRPQGGELGWYRRGDGLVPEFEDAAFALPEGAVSDVVDSPFGAHIIKVERVRGAERMIHHILISAETGDEDIERARRTAEEVREQVEAGRSIQELAREHGGAGIPDSLSLPMDQLGELPSGLSDALQGAQQGEILGPVSFELQGQPTFSVIQVAELRDEGEYTFEDVRSEVQERLRMEKLEEQLLQELRERTFVEVRF